MAANKAQFLNDVLAILKKRYKLESTPPKLSVLEATIHGICHEGATREQANQALSRFKDDFFDWNEVRVSSIEEIRGVLAGLSDPEGQAQRIRRFLRQLFEKKYSFTLDELAKKPLKDSAKALQEFEAFGSDYVTASVVQIGLGGHAIPVDEPIRRALTRLGVAEEGADLHALRSGLERAVPKNRGLEFADLMEELAHDTCVEGVPDCPRCELRKLCPTGLARKAEWSGKAATAAAKDAKAAAPRGKSPRPK